MFGYDEPRSDTVDWGFRGPGFDSDNDAGRYKSVV